MRVLFIMLLLAVCSSLQAQDIKKDSLRVETLEEVFVKSIRVSADSPVTHSNVEMKDIEGRNLGQDIPFLLDYLPSVVTTSDAGTGIGYTYMRVRGSDASRINVTLNGIPFNDAEGQGTFWVDLPDFASSVENLQLQRGVGTSTNGAGSFGASLNILTDAISKNAYVSLSNSFGSFNTRKHNIKFSTGILNDHLEFSGRASKISSNGYIDRASAQLKSYFLQGAYKDENTIIKALTFGGKEITYQAWFGIDAQTLNSDRTYNPAGMYTDDDGNVRFYENEVDNYSQDHYQILWNQRYNNHWDSNIAINYTHGKGYFEQFKEDADLEFHDIEPRKINGMPISSTDLVRRRWLDNDFYAINATLNYKKGALDIVGGAFYSYYDGDHFGEVIWARYYGNKPPGNRYYYGNGKKHDYAIFTKATWKFSNQWSLFGDLQARFIDYKTSGLTSDRVRLMVDKSFDFFNPKAGISYQLNDEHQVYFSYGRANREPRRSDFEQGIFTAEKLDDFELGYRYEGINTVLNSNFYFMNYHDQLVLSGAIDDVGAPIRTTSGRSYRFGIEVDANIKIVSSLRLKPNFSLSSNKNVDFIASIDGALTNLGNTNISFSPNLIIGNTIEFEPMKNLQLVALSKYVGDQFMGNIDSEVSKLNGYFVNDLNIVYSLDNVPYTDNVVISALVKNILNTSYVSNGYFFTYEDDFTNPGTVTTIEGAGYYPQAKMNFMLGLTVLF